MAVTERMNKLIAESAKLNERLAHRLSSWELDFLVWASPSSCRSPEEARLWHPLYARKPLFVKIGIYLYILALYSLVGVVRFFSYRGFYYDRQEKNSSILLVIPDEITDHTKSIKSSYLIEDADYPVDKLVFSRLKNVGLRFCALSHLRRAGIFGRLFVATLLDFRERLYCKEINIEYMDALIIFLRWVISQSWCFHWDFYHLMKRITGPLSSGYKAILCLHEMHFYSKVIWKVAGLRNIKGITAQHAMIIPEKLWYFPGQVEIKADCPTPDVFFVYSDEIKEMLRPCYPKTKFLLCCSPRFNRWKREAGLKSPVRKDALSILFVSGIMPYDVTILIRAIKGLLRRKDEGHVRIKLRLHPHGYIKGLDKLWIATLSEIKRIQISRASLKDDLSEASLVLGANSTVLQEALILGIPVLSMFSKDFVHPSILPDGDGWNRPLDELSWEVVKRQSQKVPDRELINRFKRNLGIFNPDLTTKLVYENAGL